jgi:hypothetical protein
METKSDIQYIFDESGNKTAVIIPISLWESMERLDIKRNFQEKRKKIRITVWNPER